jgi:26S proteasome regulatory subunit N12
MSVSSLLKDLDGAVQSANVDQGKKVLNQLKLQSLQEPGQDSLVAQALELGVLLSVADGDLDAFARHMAQLQPYYMGGLSTPRKSHIIGLNLMYLLVENRLAEFHSELELLTEALASDPLVSFPIGLERKLMVGIYDQVLTESIPHASYQFFMDHLLQTVRDSIADCTEVSYPTLSLDRAAALMKFNDMKELQEYIQTDRDDWILQGDTLTFQPPSTSGASDIPSHQWIQQSLTYATELERIV